MKFETFERLLNQYEQFYSYMHDLNLIGFDFFEGKYKLMELVSNMVKNIIVDRYGLSGMGWVDWYMFERPNLKPTEESEYHAWDADGNPICYDMQSLYNYLEKNRI